MASDSNTLEPNETLEQSARRVLVLQATLTLIATAGITGFHVAAEGWQLGIDRSKAPVFAFLYGAILGMVSTMLSKRSVSRSSQAATTTPHYAMLPVYMGLLNKLLIVGGGLAAGLVILGLVPIFIVSGYLASQLALIVVAMRKS